MAVPRHIQREHRLQLAAVCGLLILLLVVLLAVPNMLVSFVMAFVVSYLFAPAVNYLERKGLSRTAGTSLVFLCASIVAALVIYFLAPTIVEQLSGFRMELPSYIDGTTKLIADTEKRLNNFLNHYYKINISEKAGVFFLTWSTSFFEKLPQVASRTLTVVILVPFFAFFMLVDGRSASHTLLRFVPNNLFELAVNLHHQINKQMGDFVRARLLESFIVGFVIWVGLTIIQFPYTTVLASVAAFANLIPYVGPLIGAAPAFLVALINNSNSDTILIVGFIYFLAQLIDMLVIIPLVVAKIVNLHPVTVVIVIIIGSEIMGVLGMIISIPVASAIKLTTNAIYNHMMKQRI